MLVAARTVVDDDRLADLFGEPTQHHARRQLPPEPGIEERSCAVERNPPVVADDERMRRVFEASVHRDHSHRLRVIVVEIFGGLGGCIAGVIDGYDLLRRCIRRESANRHGGGEPEPAIDAFSELRLVPEAAVVDALLRIELVAVLGLDERAVLRSVRRCGGHDEVVRRAEELVDGGVA